MVTHSASARFPGSQTSKAFNITLWILQVLAAGMFLFSGELKLSGAPMMVELVRMIGIGQWFRYFTGALEVISAALLLFVHCSYQPGNSRRVVADHGNDSMEATPGFLEVRS